jgi:hypothetical protein
LGLSDRVQADADQRRFALRRRVHPRRSLVRRDAYPAGTGMSATVTPRKTRAPQRRRASARASRRARLRIEGRGRTG